MNDLNRMLTSLEERAFRKIKSAECASYRDVYNIMQPVSRAMRAINQAYIVVARAEDELNGESSFGQPVAIKG